MPVVEMPKESDVPSNDYAIRMSYVYDANNREVPADCGIDGLPVTLPPWFRIRIIRNYEARPDAIGRFFAENMHLRCYGPCQGASLSHAYTGNCSERTCPAKKERTAQEVIADAVSFARKIDVLVRLPR